MVLHVGDEDVGVGADGDVAVVHDGAQGDVAAAGVHDLEGLGDAGAGAGGEQVVPAGGSGGDELGVGVGAEGDLGSDGGAEGGFFRGAQGAAAADVGGGVVVHHVEVLDDFVDVGAEVGVADGDVDGAFGVEGVGVPVGVLDDVDSVFVDGVEDLSALPGGEAADGGVGGAGLEGEQRAHAGGGLGALVVAVGVAVGGGGGPTVALVGGVVGEELGGLDVELEGVGDGLVGAPFVGADAAAEAGEFGAGVAARLAHAVEENVFVTVADDVRAGGDAGEGGELHEGGLVGHEEGRGVVGRLGRGGVGDGERGGQAHLALPGGVGAGPTILPGAGDVNIDDGVGSADLEVDFFVHIEVGLGGEAGVDELGAGADGVVPDAVFVERLEPRVAGLERAGDGQHGEETNGQGFHGVFFWGVGVMAEAIRRRGVPSEGAKDFGKARANNERAGLEIVSVGGAREVRRAQGKVLPIVVAGGRRHGRQFSGGRAAVCRPRGGRGCGRGGSSGRLGRGGFARGG